MIPFTRALSYKNDSSSLPNFLLLLISNLNLNSPMIGILPDVTSPKQKTG